MITITLDEQGCHSKLSNLTTLSKVITIEICVVLRLVIVKQKHQYHFHLELKCKFIQHSKLVISVVNNETNYNLNLNLFESNTSIAPVCYVFWFD